MSSRHTAAQSHVNLNHRQVRIVTKPVAIEADRRFNFASRMNGNRLRWSATKEHFVRGQPTQSGMGPMPVVPDLIAPQSALNRMGPQTQEGKPLPELQCAEQAFHLAVDAPASHATLDKRYAQPPQALLEHLLELAAVIRDQIRKLELISEEEEIPIGTRSGADSNEDTDEAEDKIR